jgi:hypothetical protein
MPKGRLTAETRGKLSLVHTGGGDVDLTYFPDFFIAGPQRTGTTWLHANMRFHPEIFLSEPKEIYYFSRLKKTGDPKFVSADLDWYLAFFHELPALWLYKQAICLMRYGRFYRPVVRGEATASYAALDRDVIAEVALLNPDLKVVIMVRDPVERAWSHAKKDLARNRGRNLTEVTEGEFRAFFEDPYQRQCARYVENVANWRAALGHDQVLVGRFEDVTERPEPFLIDVLEFLGVSTDRRYVPKSVREPVNPTSEGKVPEQHRRFLERLLEREIESWRAAFGSPRPS